MVANSPREAYLRPSPWIDADHPEVRAFLDATGWDRLDEVERARAAYTFVRDEVAHSWDAQDRRVTRTASEVLRERVGICYAKAHLLAALLRSLGLPTGLCYQRLLLGDDPKDGYALHALNAVYLSSLDRWVRMDARGNRNGIEAEFSLDEERLAFRVRPALGEQDYKSIFAEPPPEITECINQASDMLDTCRHRLPGELELSHPSAGIPPSLMKGS
jgi:transglutaminase-like putative cysteine protease